MATQQCLFIPAVLELNVFVLKELHDANQAGHVTFHRTQHSVQRRSQANLGAAAFANS